ncbi:CVNH domain-containing protein [Aaosphaeria arxii CBS 175.79]|uniref:CVNH domain-containing protein n=1 Tax=Aaosphaeria arxii CBS 175.79 TaxID=1450172 RepID=A0A6A5XMK8_9PLEO|nr:CVNH domain-containing protein [Aaosphaeria arxii CBS 175.79]KAF2014478.1 CVNH domain-containing protein [Aaosphaeria arxii CBS 175.79]
MPDFHASAQDIELDGSVLKAHLFDVDGESHEVEIELNDILGNENGSFLWGGGGFNDTAEDVHLSFEGDDNWPILRARLQNEDGDFVDADVNLAERIGNNNGEFTFE